MTRTEKEDELVALVMPRLHETADDHERLEVVVTRLAVYIIGLQEHVKELEKRVNAALVGGLG